MTCDGPRPCPRRRRRGRATRTSLSRSNPKCASFARIAAGATLQALPHAEAAGRPARGAPSRQSGLTRARAKRRVPGRQGRGLRGRVVPVPNRLLWPYGGRAQSEGGRQSASEILTHPRGQRLPTSSSRSPRGQRSSQPSRSSTPSRFWERSERSGEASPMRARHRTSHARSKTRHATVRSSRRGRAARVTEARWVSRMGHPAGRSARALTGAPDARAPGSWAPSLGLGLRARPNARDARQPSPPNAQLPLVRIRRGRWQKPLLASSTR
jgi:hypothetical protein